MELVPDGGYEAVCTTGRVFPICNLILKERNRKQFGPISMSSEKFKKKVHYVMQEALKAG